MLAHFFAFVSTQFSTNIKDVQCDSGCEFDNTTFARSSLLMVFISACRVHPQNGRAERIIHSINIVGHSLLFQASFPLSFWVEILHTATALDQHITHQNAEVVYPAICPLWRCTLL